MRIQDLQQSTINNSVKEEEVIKEEVKPNDSFFESIDPEDVAYAKKVSELKRSNKRLYVTEIADEKIIWRPLKRSEYKAMLSIEFPEGTSEEDKVFDRETFIANTVILHPVGIAEDLAMVAEMISTACLMKSGFADRTDFTYDEV